MNVPTLKRRQWRLYRIKELEYKQPTNIDRSVQKYTQNCFTKNKNKAATYNVTRHDKKGDRTYYVYILYNTIKKCKSVQKQWNKEKVCFLQKVFAQLRFVHSNINSDGKRKKGKTFFNILNMFKHMSA